MIVSTGTLMYSGISYKIRYDSKAGVKSWKLFSDSVSMDQVNTLSNIKPSEIIFATYVEDNEPPKVYGNIQMASLFLADVIAMNALTQRENARSYQGYWGEASVNWRESSSKDSTVASVKVAHTSKTLELAYMETLSPNFSMIIKKVKGKANFYFSGLTPDEDYVSMSELSDTIKGVTVALQFPTLEEMIQRFGLRDIFDENMKLVKDYRILKSEKELDEIIRLYIANANILSVDIESNGLLFSDLPEDHPANCKIVDIIISWEVGQSILIPFAHTEVSYNFDPKKTLKKLEPYFTSKPCVGAHTKFDQRVLKFYGVDINFTEDVLLMWYNLDPMRAKHIQGLKNILGYFGKIQPSLSKIAKGAETNVALFPTYLMYCYCCADSDNTLWLYYKLRELLPKSSYYGYKQDIRMSYYLASDEYFTTHIDTAMLSHAITCADMDKRHLEDLMFKLVGQYIVYKNAELEADAIGLNKEEKISFLEEFRQTDDFKTARKVFDPTQDEQLRDILYNIYRIPPVAKTSSGKLSVSAPTLKKYIGESRKTPLAEEEKLKDNVYSTIASNSTHLTKEDAVLLSNEYNATKFPFIYVYSRWKVVHSEQIKFFYPLRKMVANTQGRVCLSFRTTHTETYRITHKLQTLKGVLKKLVVPPPNHYCFGGDAAAIEYRVVANEAGEQKLIISLTDPERDYHKEVAAIAFNKLAEEITKEERKKVKPVNFGSIYGISEYGLCTNSLGLDPTPENLKFAAELIATIKLAIPEIFRYLTACSTISYNEGIFLNADKRIRVFDKEKNSKSRILRQALNFPIQSYAAGIFRQIYINMKDAYVEQGIIDKVKTYLLVHDEFQNYAHEDICPWHLCSIAWNKCTIRPEGKAPYYLGVGFGNNWYEAKDDRSELPVKFLEIKAKEWDEGKYQNWNMPASEVPAYVYREMQAYMFDRYMEELLDNGGVDPLTKTVETFHLHSYVKNYYIKGRIEHFVEMEIDKKNKSSLTYEDIAYLLIVMHLWKVDSLVSKETGKLITKEELMSESYVTYMKSDIFYGDGVDVVSTKHFRSNVAKFVDIDLDDMEIGVGFENEMELLDIPDSFSQGDYTAEIDFDINKGYGDEGYVAPKFQRDSEGNSFMTFEGVSDNFQVDSLKTLGYSVTGSMLTIKPSVKNFDKVVAYIKSLLTDKLLDNYTVTFRLPTGEDKVLKHRIVPPDWDYLSELLGNPPNESRNDKLG